MTVVLSSLKPDLNLLNSSFETYKLSLKTLSIDEQKIPKEIFTKTLDHNEYSLQHVKAFGIHNSLILDPWNYSDAYFITSDLKILKASVNDFGKLDTCISVFSIPQSTTNGKYHNPCLKFVSQKLACISDGTNNLFLIDTGKRGNSEECNVWEVILKDQPLEESHFQLVAVHISESDNIPPLQFDCIVLSVLEVSVNESNSAKKNCFNTHLNWLTYSAEESGLSLSRHRSLIGDSVPDFLSFEPGANYLHVCSEAPFHFVHDSKKAVQPGSSGDDVSNGHGNSGSEKYKWRQGQTEITLEFPLEQSGVKEENVEISISDRRLIVHLNEEILFDAELFGQIKQEDVVKTICIDKLEVTLHKVENSSEFWHSLTSLSNTDKIDNPDDAANIKKEIDKAFVPDDSNPAYNVEQLEECDAMRENESYLLRLDGESKQVTHQVNLGADHYLFTALVNSDTGVPCVCLRHDVDALIWMPTEPFNVKRSGSDPESTCWRHIVTFSALGYVTASKEDRKYSTCSPDASYAVLCDSSRRLFIYEQPKPLSGDGQLRNRKTGKCVSDVAAQRVVTLSDSAQIEGCRANNRGIFVITKETLYFIQMPETLDI